MAASTTRRRRGAPLRGGREKKGFKVAALEYKGGQSAYAWAVAGRPLLRPTPYSLNWEFVNSQNKVSDVFDLNMSRICGGKEWIF